MKKKALTTLMAASMALAVGGTAFGAEWKKDDNGWWWQEDNGSYPVSTWQWIDGNGDGVAECYFFNEKGYNLQNAATPDGYTVDASGAWIVDGVVQTKTSEASAAAAGTEASQYQDDYSGVYEVPFYEADGSIVMDSISVVYDGSANAISVTYPRFDITLTYTYAGPDYRGVMFFELISEEEKDAIFFLAPGVIEWPTDDGRMSFTRK